MGSTITPLGYLCLGCAVAALAIIARHLWKKPKLDFHNKMWLLMGLGVLPTLSATTSTVTGMQATTERQFCGSCHTMDLHVGDANDPNSQSLAARHARNPFFGDRNCYVCHADYGMYGYPLTKLNGMRHVYEYYLGGWKEISLEDSLAKLHLRKPYDNDNCRQCHTGTAKDWSSVPEHIALANELESNQVACASAGCHGFAHPFTKGAPQSDVPPGVSAEAAERLRDARSAAARAKASAERAKEERKEAAQRAAKEAARERTRGKDEPAKAVEAKP